jgi:hypothetical protein
MMMNSPRASEPDVQAGVKVLKLVEILLQVGAEIGFIPPAFGNSILMAPIFLLPKVG